MLPKPVAVIALCRKGNPSHRYACIHFAPLVCISIVRFEMHTFWRGGTSALNTNTFLRCGSCYCSGEEPAARRPAQPRGPLGPHLAQGAGPARPRAPLRTQESGQRVLLEAARLPTCPAGTTPGEPIHAVPVDSVLL